MCMCNAHPDWPVLCVAGMCPPAGKGRASQRPPPRHQTYRPDPSHLLHHRRIQPWPVLAIAAFWGAAGRAHSGTCPKPLAPSPLPEARPVPGGGPGPISQVHVAFPPSAAGLENCWLAGPELLREHQCTDCGPPLATGHWVWRCCCLQGRIRVGIQRPK